jgi:hypothetical protein
VSAPTKTPSAIPRRSRNQRRHDHHARRVNTGETNTSHEAQQDRSSWIVDVQAKYGVHCSTEDEEMAKRSLVLMMSGRLSVALMSVPATKPSLNGDSDPADL